MTNGAYGLRLGGRAPRSSLLSATPPQAPEILINRMLGTIELPNRVDDDQATVPLLDGGGLQLDRAARTALITTAHELTDDELAHPYLAPIAAVHSHWLGRAAFHAGAIVVADRAWGVIGEREAGKSTLLAGFHAAGGIVLADDLLVMDGAEVYAGPRTLDLRREAADWFPEARALGVAGARERWRLDLRPAPYKVALGGWIVPSWGDDLAVVARAGAAAAHYIAPARSVPGLAIDPKAFMAAAAHPAVEFVRPRRMDDLESGVAVLTAALERIGAPEPEATGHPSE